MKLCRWWKQACRLFVPFGAWCFNMIRQCYNKIFLRWTDGRWKIEEASSYAYLDLPIYLLSCFYGGKICIGTVDRWRRDILEDITQKNTLNFRDQTKKIYCSVLLSYDYLLTNQPYLRQEALAFYDIFIHVFVENFPAAAPRIIYFIALPWSS